MGSFSYYTLSAGITGHIKVGRIPQLCVSGIQFSRKAELTKLHEEDKSNVKELSAVKKNIDQYLSNGNG